MSSADTGVLEKAQALQFTRGFSGQSCDALDLLPAPIWHIILQKLLLPPSEGPNESAEAQQQDDSGLAMMIRRDRLWGYLREERVDLSGLTRRQQHEDLTTFYGSSLPLLPCAMASKRLLHHVLAFLELKPMEISFASECSWWFRSVRWLLQWPGLKSLKLCFFGVEDFLNFGRLVSSNFPAHSVTSLHLWRYDENRDAWYGEGYDQKLIDLAFLEKFGQLQQLKLERARWKLRGFRADWFKSLKSLTIHQLLQYSSSNLEILAAVTPQLHKFSLSASSMHHISCDLTFAFSEAQVIEVNFGRQSLKLNFSLPPSLKSFSAKAGLLQIACQSSNLPSLDSLSLITSKQLMILSLPVAAATAVHLQGPTSHEEALSLSDPVSDLVSEDPSFLTCSTSLIRFLCTIVPTVESLAVRHGLPIREVRAEWSRLHSLTYVGRCYCTYREAVRPLAINAPKLQSISATADQCVRERVALPPPGF